jgi:hypothetical protein
MRQRVLRGAIHSLQNFIPSGFSNSQFELRMNTPSWTAVSAAGQHEGRFLRRTPMLDMHWMVWHYSRACQVSSEKYETAPEAGGARRNTLAVGTITIEVDGYWTRPESQRSAAVPPKL